MSADMQYRQNMPLIHVIKRAIERENERIDRAQDEIKTLTAELKELGVDYLPPWRCVCLQLNDDHNSPCGFCERPPPNPLNPGHQGTTHLVRRTLDGVVETLNEKGM